MLEDELSIFLYMVAYPFSVLFNTVMDFVGAFLGVFLGVFTSGIGIINAFNTAIYALVCIALPAELAGITLIIFYILGFYYLIKLIKTIWDVLPFA
jgi:hypothetical protein